MFIRPFVLWLESLIKQSESTLTLFWAVNFFFGVHKSTARVRLRKPKIAVKRFSRLLISPHCLLAPPWLCLCTEQTRKAISANILIFAERSSCVVKHLWCIASINCFHLLAFINTWIRLYSILFSSKLFFSPSMRSERRRTIVGSFFEMLPIFVCIREKKVHWIFFSSSFRASLWSGRFPKAQLLVTSTGWVRLEAYC